MALIGPTVETIGDVALTDSIIDKSITEIQDELVTDIREHAFYNCTALKKAVFGSVSDVDDRAFDGCTALTTVDFHTSTPFGDYVFNNCSALTALILRGATVCHAISGTLQNSGIASGNGYVYVPAALVDAYKAHSAWGQYSSQIRAIEDYPAMFSNIGKVWVKSDYSIPQSVAYGNGLFVSATNGGIKTSEDGKKWTHRYSENGGRMVRYVNGVWFVACTTAKPVLYSNDGITWNQSDLSTVGGDMCYMKGKWLIGGNSGIYYSTDGISWTQSNITTTATGGFATDGSICVCGTSSGLVYSTDGITWTQSNMTQSAYGPVWVNGLWVSGSKKNGAYYSRDGKTWAQDNLTSGQFFNVAFGNGKWVICGNNGVYHSADGMTWQSCVYSGQTLYSVLYVDSLWVAGANYKNEGLFYSTDGITWTQSNVTTCGTVYDIAYGNGVLVAAAYTGVSGASGVYYSDAEV